MSDGSDLTLVGTFTISATEAAPARYFSGTVNVAGTITGVVRSISGNTIETITGASVPFSTNTVGYNVNGGSASFDPITVNAPTLPDLIGGTDTLTGGTQNDTMMGFDGADTINGNNGDDTIAGGAGSDFLHGGSGGEVKGDTLDYSDGIAGVSINLATGTALGGFAVGDEFDGFENVTGGAGSDLLVGDAGNNILTGGDGNDVINGGLGDDVIEGGLGNDVLRGGGVAGNLGSDTVSYQNADKGVTVSLANVLAQNTVGAGFDTLSGIRETSSVRPSTTG